MRELLLSGAIVLSGAGMALADTIHWKDVAGWNVSVDPSFTIDSCYVGASYNGGTYLRIGADPAGEAYYILFGNDEWRSIEPGRDYRVDVFFGDETPWKLIMQGGKWDTGLRYVHARVDNSLLLAEFAEEVSVRFFFEGTKIDQLSLDGSLQAVRELLQCQEAMREDTREASADPFAPDDPFRQASSDPFEQ